MLTSMSGFVTSLPLTTNAVFRPLTTRKCTFAPTPAPARVRVRKGTCKARALSEQDKEYVEKVRKRLLHGETAAARNTANRRRTYEPPDSATAATAGGHGMEAMALFRAGQYATAVPEFRRAVAAVGANSAEGGRLTLWLAQALSAAGEHSEAVAVLEALQAHPDGEVANTAAELLFIVNAPRLEVPRNAFLTVPVADFRSASADETQTRHLAASGLARRTKRRKKIEKYSLEWYAAQPRTSKADRERSQQQFGTEIVFAVVVTALLAMALGGGS